MQVQSLWNLAFSWCKHLREDLFINYLVYILIGNFPFITYKYQFADLRECRGTARCSRSSCGGGAGSPLVGGDQIHAVAVFHSCSCDNSIGFDGHDNPLFFLKIKYLKGMQSTNNTPHPQLHL